MAMSPVEIEVALHYHYRTEDVDFTPAHKNAINGLVRAGLLEDTGVGGTKSQRYKPTQGLHVYVSRLCQVPLPVQKLRWVFNDDLDE